jgi:hypothetical protein
MTKNTNTVLDWAYCVLIWIAVGFVMWWLPFPF